MPHTHPELPPLTTEQEDLPFSSVPEAYHITALGVPYVRNPDGEGGVLYVTRWGWHRLAHLRPDNWYKNRSFVKQGTRLRQSTGTVYFYPSRVEGTAPMDLLVKVSRLAEHVPGQTSADIPGLKSLQDATFNSPFEEFSLVEDLRASRFGPPHLHVRTKRPLAIYCGPKDLPSWQLGRRHWDFLNHSNALEQDQEGFPKGHRIQLEKSRQYFLLYAWVPGIDAQEAMLEGLISEDEVRELTERVNRELEMKGFRILDNKPKHIILRVGRDGLPIRHLGKLMYVQIDFELMVRTEAYTNHLRSNTSETQSPYLYESAQL